MSSKPVDIENPFIAMGSDMIERGAPADMVATHLTAAGVSLWFALLGAHGVASVLEEYARRLRSDPATALEEAFARSTGPTQ